MANVARVTEPPSGGHFAAFEEPELYVEELRAFFRPPDHTSQADTMKAFERDCAARLAQSLMKHNHFTDRIAWRNVVVAIAIVPSAYLGRSNSAREPVKARSQRVEVAMHDAVMHLTRTAWQTYLAAGQTTKRGSDDFRGAPKGLFAFMPFGMNDYIQVFTSHRPGGRHWERQLEIVAAQTQSVTNATPRRKRASNAATKSTRL